MFHIKIGLASLTGLLLLSCAPEPSAGILDQTAPEVSRFRGELTLGHESRSFRPCGAGQDDRVVDETAGGELWRVHEELSSEPYQPLYVEVLGSLNPAPADGFGAGRRRQINITELLRAQREGRGCAEDLSRFAFRAAGNEPSWNVVVSEAGIAYSELGGPRRLEFPYNPPQGTAYRSELLAPNFQIEIAFEEGRCIDTMSGERFSHTATVRFNGKEMTGCGYEGVPPSGGPIQYRIRTIEETTSGCGPEEREACTWFRFDYPEITGGAPETAVSRANAHILDWIRHPLEEGAAPAPPEELASRLEEAYREFKSEFPESSQSWTLRRTASLLHSSNSILSFRLDENSFLGGAHPNQAIRLLNLRADTGGEIEISGLIQPGELENLVVIAERNFRQAKGIPSAARLSAAGYRFDGDTFTLPKNFAITGAGLLLHFNVYEIGPRPLGSTELVIPFAELGGVLRSEYSAQ